MTDLLVNFSAPLNVLYALAPTIVMLIAANLLVDRSGAADALAIRAEA